MRYNVRHHLFSVVFFLFLFSFVFTQETNSTSPTAQDFIDLKAEVEQLKKEAKNTEKIEDMVWVIRSSFAVLTMQYGFAMIETGFVRPRTTVNILYKNLISTVMCGVAYFLTGWAFAFGKSFHGLIGTNEFAIATVGTKEDEPYRYGLWNFHYSFAAAATTIMSGAMAERTSILAYVILTVFMSGFTYPVVSHWCWNSEGWLNKLGALDFAGDGPVHMLGGIMALCGTTFIGPRLGRFGYKREVMEELLLIEEGIETGRGSAAEGEALEIRRALPGELSLKEKETLLLRVLQDNPPVTSPGYIVFGTIVLWVSWYAFNSGSSGGLSNGNYVTAFTATVSTSIAPCSGAMTGFILSLILDRGTYDIRRPVNGALAGLVGITAPCAWVDPWASFVIGVVATLSAWAVELLIVKLKIDDPVSAIAVHLGGGISGEILTGIFHTTEGLAYTGSFQLLWKQCVAIVSIFTFGTFFGYFFLFITNLVVKIRVPMVTEMFGIDALTHNSVGVDEVDNEMLALGGITSIRDVKDDVSKLDNLLRKKLTQRLKEQTHDKKSVFFLQPPAKSSRVITSTEKDMDDRSSFVGGSPNPSHLDTTSKSTSPGVTLKHQTLRIPGSSSSNLQYHHKGNNDKHGKNSPLPGQVLPFSDRLSDFDNEDEEEEEKEQGVRGKEVEEVREEVKVVKHNGERDLFNVEEVENLLAPSSTKPAPPPSKPISSKTRSSAAPVKIIVSTADKKK